jgi:hypothetical protein
MYQITPLAKQPKLLRNTKPKHNHPSKHTHTPTHHHTLDTHTALYSSSTTTYIKPHNNTLIIKATTHTIIRPDLPKINPHHTNTINQTKIRPATPMLTSK